MIDRPDLISLLVEKWGALVDAQDNQGNTALHHAVLLGNTKSIECLLNGFSFLNRNLQTFYS